MSTKKEIRVGLVGYGFMGRTHSNAYKRVGDFFPELTYRPVLKAVCGRNEERVKEFAEQWGYESIETDWKALIARDDIDAIDICTPNNMHAEVAIAAAKAGKMVLCEKPLALSAIEAKKLIAARDRTGVQIEEAFMVRTHPQWIKVKQLVESGSLGEVRAIQGFFSYYNRDPENVRNVPEWGGGGIMDIGCYPIVTSRFVLGREPERVFAVLENDPEFRVDRLASGILDYGDIQSSFACSTQLVAHQRMLFLGTEKKVEVEIPFNAPPDRPCRLFVSSGDLFGEDVETIELPICNQYTIQGELFSACVRGERTPPMTLEDSVRNMAGIDALFRSAESGRWESPSAGV